VTHAALGRHLDQVPLALIDDPAIPARETMDDEKFLALVASVKAIGIIQPIAVKATGARYEVVAGHRRTLAARVAELERVPCLIVDGAADLTEAIKLHENNRREDLNPAEEALWFNHLLDTLAGGDTTRLAELLGEERQYVEKRLVLLRDDAEVFAALRSGAISLTVAVELNKFQDVGARRSHLDAAMKGGATGRLVREWRIAYERLVGQRADVDSSGTAHVGGVVQPADSVLTCLFCSSSADPHVMQLVYMHAHCLMAFERVSGVPLRGVFAAPSPAIATPAAEPAQP
jgi:ParB/RepB/Spo0J family partition protein